MRILSRLRSEFFPKPDPFDVANDVETSGIVSLIRLRIQSGNRHFGTRYQPVHPEWFAKAMGALDKDASNFTFIDLGCGKGRALVMARQYGFRRVIGIEFSDSLAEVARTNTRGTATRVITGDAAHFSFPNELLCVFLYNPFGPEVLQAVLGHLNDATGLLVYVNPVHRAIVNLSPVLDSHEVCAWRLPGHPPNN